MDPILASATRRGVPAPAALERLREYLRHDASEADVAVAFAGGGAAALLRRVAVDVASSP